MAIEIKVPRLGWSMEEGTFIEWLKKEGQAVRAGEPLFAIEGDKAIQEVEAIASGILRIPPTAPENGETVKVGMTLGFLVEADEAEAFDTTAVWPVADATAPTDRSLAASSAGDSSRHDDDAESHLTGAGAAPLPAARQTTVGPTTTGLSAGRRPRISPRAARVARELGVDWQTVSGTGRSGRIRERDVREAATWQTVDRREASPSVKPARRPSTAAGTSYRKTIAARMLEGAHATAPVTLTTTADATNLVSLRRQFKTAIRSEGEIIPSYLDVVVKLVARALQEHPALNQQWIDGRIVCPDGVHIAVAVDTPAGLLAPVLRDVPSLPVREIAARTSELARRAQSAQLAPAELGGGTFTISNLGAFGIDAFTPIINVPQCAILGLGRIDRRPAVVGGADQIVPRDMVTLSLTFDHRIVDGAPAARFLATVSHAIENPGPWLVF